ncbi:unnamed protein product [Pedinophyceae sp. YPF-701]|nr:unnamed protein product [Pedinophyceae sp. YPF-701]
MVAKAEDVAARLASATQGAERLEALRAVRNLAVGNRTKKRALANLGAAEALVGIINAGQAPGQSPSDLVRAEVALAASALGSLAFDSEEGLNAVAASAATPALLSLLHSPDPTLFLAATRALKMVLRQPAARHLAADHLDAQHVARIVDVLRAAARRSASAAGPSSGAEGCAYPDGTEARRAVAAEDACVILAAVCAAGPHVRKYAIAAGALEATVGAMDGSRGRALEAALDALGAMTRGDSQAARTLLSSPRALKELERLARAGERDVQLPACRILANIAPVAQHSPETEAVCLAARVALSRLLVRSTAAVSAGDAACMSCGGLRAGAHGAAEAGVADPGGAKRLETVLHALAELAASCSGSEGATMDTCTVARLTALIKSPGNASPTARDGILEGALRALGASMVAHEEPRLMALDARVLPPLLAALESSSPGVRAAACACLRALTRSVRVILAAVKEPAMVRPLLAILSAHPKEGEACVEAAAALSNLVLQHDRMKEEAVRQGGIPMLVNLAKCSDTPLRIMALGVLKNLLYDAENSVIVQVARTVGGATIEALLGDDSVGVRCEAAAVVRNMLVGKEEDIKAVLDAFGPEHGILAKIQRMVSEPATAGSEQVVERAAGVVANLCAASKLHCSWVIRESKIPEHLLDLIKTPLTPAPTVKTCLWALYNMLYVLPGSPQSDVDAAKERVDHLCSLGLEEVARPLVTAATRPQEVHERARCVLEVIAQLRAGNRAPQEADIA